jgi:hypothetical protein
MIDANRAIKRQKLLNEVADLLDERLGLAPGKRSSLLQDGKSLVCTAGGPAGTKNMALLGGTYPVAAFVRTTEEGLDSARAMLDLRSLDLSNRWEAFTAFPIERESQRLDPGSPAKDADFSQPLAA